MEDIGDEASALEFLRRLEATRKAGMSLHAEMVLEQERRLYIAVLKQKRQAITDMMRLIGGSPDA